MKQIKTIKHEKIWGYEIWLYSPVPGKETSFVDGSINKKGPLVKIIKANNPLSVQVHPDDGFAKELENQPNGKSEAWYVLEAKKDSTLVSGLKSYNEKTIREAIKNKTFNNLLIHTKVKPGDFFNIPAGMVHGIGAGITVLEVQQPSDVTYRYYDYDRLENGKPRELHIDKAIKVQKDLDFKLDPDTKDYLSFTNKVGNQSFFKKDFKLLTKSIVVNLDTYDSYIANISEIISFANYAVIEFK